MKTPIVCSWILKKLFPDNGMYTTVADVEEVYFDKLEEFGTLRAGLWLWNQTLRALILIVRKNISGSPGMFNNYLKIALRNIIRHKGYMFINVFGLAIGFGIYILSTVFSMSMLNGSDFYKDADRIYGVIQVKSGGNQGESHSAIIPGPVLPAIMDEFPEIEDATRFFRSSNNVLGYENVNFSEGSVYYVDSSFLNLFTFEMISGNPENVLAEPYSIVFTESMIQKYFGDEDPIGKVLTLNNEIDITVTGVTKDAPDFAGIHYDFLISMGTLIAEDSGSFDSWRVDSQSAMLKLREGVEGENLDDKLQVFAEKHFGQSVESPDRLYLFPLKEFTFGSNHIISFWTNEPILAVYVFFGMGILILLVACINFMNLSTARYSNRAREVGLRKVVGAQRHQIVKQFLGESLLMSLIALPIGIVLFEIMRPLFIAFYNYQFNITLWDKPGIMINIGVVAIISGLFAGSYPAFFLSSFKPIQTLQGKLQSGKKGNFFRKFLVVSQFGLSIVLIIFTVVVSNQFDNLMNYDLGYNRENIFFVNTSNIQQSDADLFEAGVQRSSNVENITFSNYLPGLWENERKVLTEGMDISEAIRMDIYNVDINFPELLGMDLIDGRTFSTSFSDEGNFIITETVSELLRMEEPIGKQLTVDNETGQIIGVVSDFILRSFYRPTAPGILRLKESDHSYMLIKTSSPIKLSEMRESLKIEWKRIVPEQPFHVSDFNDSFSRWHEGTKKGSEVCGAIGIITIFVSCLGLFGLASFTIEKRRKEIGVRKVLGASTELIVKLLVNDFLILVLVANLTAWPLGYMLSRLFIESMYTDYPIVIGVSVYVFAAMITLLSGVIAVFSQTFKAARANPVDSLRYE